MKKYTLNLLGLTRELPIIELNNDLKIAGFNSLGDTELLNKAALDLYNQLKPHQNIDILVTTECKGIGITQELARLLNIDYIVLRKSSKVYLGECYSVSGSSITSSNSTYFISKDDAKKLNKKKIAFVDDVISTGETFKAAIDLLEKLKDYSIDCELLYGICVLIEGSISQNLLKALSNFIVFYCDKLPLQ